MQEKGGRCVLSGKFISDLGQKRNTPSEEYHNSTGPKASGEEEFGIHGKEIKKKSY